MGIVILCVHFQTQYLRFSQQYCCRFKSSGMLSNLDCCSALVFSVKQFKKSQTVVFIVILSKSPWTAVMPFFMVKHFRKSRNCYSAFTFKVKQFKKSQTAAVPSSSGYKTVKEFFTQLLYLHLQCQTHQEVLESCSAFTS